MESRNISILVVDDDVSVGRVLCALIAQAGMHATYESSAEAALERLNQSSFDLVVTDLRMPVMDGMQLLKEVVKNWPDIGVIMLTAFGTVANAVEAMKAGATDFMLKPFDRDEVIYTITKSLKTTERLRDKPPDRALISPTGLIAVSKPMQELCALLQRAAQSSATVLLRGESGTGKELAAINLHQLSDRKDGPFIVVHCAALPENLLESELFGYEKGAFTGATTKKPGRVELANNGTLFLDEIAELPLSMQAKLLRVMQDRVFQRLGATKSEKADVRFVAATHRDLEAMVRDGQFREDLFYRINVLPIWLPPLRERSEDIPLLAEHFCEKSAAETQRPNLRVENDAMELISRIAWPGNVRQLQNFIERLVVFVDGERIRLEDVKRELARYPDTLSSQTLEGTDSDPELRQKVLKSKKLEAERSAVVEALRKARNNRTVAARILGISRRTLYKKIDLFDL
jgi:two-component system response regulator AtoC